MSPSDSRHTRRSGRARRRPDDRRPEGLESRELMAYSPLGFSLPDLTVPGFAAPAASWGGPLAVTVDRPEPGRQHDHRAAQPVPDGPAPTPAASPARATPTRRRRSSTSSPRPSRARRPFIDLGRSPIPAVSQNSFVQSRSDSPCRPGRRASRARRQDLPDLRRQRPTPILERATRTTSSSRASRSDRARRCPNLRSSASTSRRRSSRATRSRRRSGSPTSAPATSAAGAGHGRARGLARHRTSARETRSSRPTRS